jgi:peptidoglycan/LPS O-acetylase OafA/YrhL
VAIPTVSGGAAPPRLGFRPELDTLRAVAVAMVITAHYLGWAGIGRGGVISFLVLSGFLITTLMLEEHRERGWVDVPGFYLRRLRRLAPALLLMLGVVAAISAGSGALSQLPGVLASLLYVSNWAPALGVNMGVLGHMWSLGVEQQFYLAVPLAFLGFGRSRVLAAGAVAGAIAVLAISGQEGFAPIVIGCSLAWLRWSGRLASRAWHAVIGVAIVVSLGAIDVFAAWQSTAGFALTGLGAALVIAWALNARPHWLAYGPTVYLGRISYGIYLWHLPLGLLFFPALVHVMPAQTALLLLVGLTVVVAACSYRLVEQPFLMRRSQAPRALDGASWSPNPTVTAASSRHEPMASA